MHTDNIDTEDDLLELIDKLQVAVADKISEMKKLKESNSNLSWYLTAYRGY